MPACTRTNGYQEFSPAIYNSQIVLFIKYAMLHKDIYHIISKYYHIEENINAKAYGSRAARRRTIKRTIDNKLSENKVQWNHLGKEIESTFPNLLAVKQGSQPVDTCYTIVLLITTRKFENVTFTQELFCHFSLLEDFFCIYGKDKIYLIDDGRKLNFDPIITISPENIYEDYYAKLRLIVEKTFPNYNFLTFLSLQGRITGLRIFSTFVKENQYSSVFQALFTPENITDYNIRGDFLYK